MTLQVEFWTLVTLAITLFGFATAAGKILLTQIDRRLYERFAAMEKARIEGAKHWEDKFTELIAHDKEESRLRQDLERQFLNLKAELPVQYVRREDYVRGQTIIEAKLDALYSKIETIRSHS